MAFTVPTTSDFIALFSDFAATSTALLDKALEIAQGYVDDSWCSQTDFEMGIFYKMASWLTQMGEGGAAATAAVGDYKTFKSGEAGFTRFTAAELSNDTSGAGAKDYDAMFNALLRQNRGGPFTTAAY